jgi:hypothetical protein
MPTLVTWLLALAWPIAKKILVSLGIGIVSYAGLSLIGSQIENAIVSSYGALGGYIADIFGLAGINTCIGIILGAINARIALNVAGRLGRVASS